MEALNSNWKSTIFSQLKEHNRQRHGYDEIIEHYNHVWESNTNLQTQCIQLGKDVNHLRLTNAGLEKCSNASEELTHVNNKLQAANDELVTHLREKSELAREVLRLNHALDETSDRLTKEEIKVRQYKIENEQLRDNLKKSEFEIHELTQTKQIVQEEFQALQSQIDQLQMDYFRMKPTCLEMEQQLRIAQRTNDRLEDELLRNKNQQAELHDLETERFNRIPKRVDPLQLSEMTVFVDDDLVIVPSMKNVPTSHSPGLYNSNHQDMMSYSYDESSHRDRKCNTTSSSSGHGESLFTSLMRKFTHGIHPSSNDRLYRTSINCISACIPTREVTNWDCTQLEVYSLQFQPSGSILATGCSDKMVHLWEISSTGQQHKYCSLHGSHGAINALDFDNEGYRLLAGCSGDKAYIWSYGEQRMLKDTLTGHQGLIATCKFISGTKLTTGSADRTIKIWDLNTRQCTRTILVGSKCHDLVVIDAAGTMISGHYDKKIRIWDSYTDKCRAEFPYDAAITSLSYNDERQQLLACFKNDTLRLIDLRQNQTLHTFSDDNFKVSTDTTKAVLSPDGHYACAGSQDGSLVIWNMENRTCENVLKRKHTTMVTAVAWQPDGKYVASCEKHRRVMLWSD